MTEAGATELFGVEWVGQPSHSQSGNLGWPELRAAERCDGENPMTGRPCVNGTHNGYHRDNSGAEWLDD
jgi:hypothetical protein